MKPETGRHSGGPPRGCSQRGGRAARCNGLWPCSRWLGSAPTKRIPSALAYYAEAAELLRMRRVRPPPHERVMVRLEPTDRHGARDRPSAAAGGVTIGRTRRPGHTTSEALPLEFHIAGPRRPGRYCSQGLIPNARIERGYRGAAINSFRIMRHEVRTP